MCLIEGGDWNHTFVIMSNLSAFPHQPRKPVHHPGSRTGSHTPTERASQHVLLLPYSKSIWIHTFQSITARCHQTYPVWNSVKPITFHVLCINPSTMPISIFKMEPVMGYLNAVMRCQREKTVSGTSATRKNILLRLLFQNERDALWIMSLHSI